MIQVIPVILCGGSGTRLWSLSRTGFSKQFLCLTCNESLFQQAAQRLSALGCDHIKVASPVIVSGEDHRFLASEQLREVGIALGAALLEPKGCNTASALTMALLPPCKMAKTPCRSSRLQTNYRQASGICRRRATSHRPSRARQHRHLGRHPRLSSMHCSRPTRLMLASVLSKSSNSPYAED